LIQTPGGDLARCMRHLNGIYTQRFNRAHHCEGMGVRPTQLTSQDLILPYLSTV
jgi:hypothetical protein